MSWRDELQQASFNGVPFAVLGGEGRFGRRGAVHEYPMRDTPYVEDLGRATRRLSLTGFLVENSLVYGGGSVIAQRERLIAAAETPGPATLIHPTLGRLTVSLPEDGLSVAEKWDGGRYFEIRFSFIESGERLFPIIGQASRGLLNQRVDQLGLASAAAFARTLVADIHLGLGVVKGVLSLGHAVIGGVVGVVADVNVIAGQISRDATSLFNMASLLTGDVGRYVNANVSSAFLPLKTHSGVPWTIASLEALGAENRAAVQNASGALTSAAQALDASSVTTLPNRVQDLMDALAAVTMNPGDAINRLAALATFAATPAAGTGQVAAGVRVAQAAMSALVHRLALGAIAQAVGSYVPRSYDDAAALRAQVTDDLDAEMEVPGSIGDDEAYLALRALRQAIVQALSSSGANRAPLKTFTVKVTLPSLALAQRLYQDAHRNDQLVAQVDPIHPAFMPVRFRALAG